MTYESENKHVWIMHWVQIDFLQKSLYRSLLITMLVRTSI